MALQLHLGNCPTHVWKSSTPSPAHLCLRVRASSSSSSDGAQLRRPAAPTVKESITPPPPPPESTSPESAPAPAAVNPIADSGVSVEFQRQRAKELQEFFLDKKYEQQVAKNRIFGFSQKNEVGNGRWAMFGIAVGMLTEYATGSSFVDQLKIIISNLGIADV